MNTRTAITPTRAEDFPEWYQSIVKAAELADNSPVRGCMVIRPWGYGIWENLQKKLDAAIKDTGHENAYFPLLIPISFLEKEAKHVEGFAKECAVVTHHRLEQQGDQLIPTGKLEEPLIIRPTSETIIGDSFAKWIKSYRDLPVLINQWANVVRWELRPRLFLRTAEFLWQEGHTAHATEKEALEETELMLEVYKKLYEDVLAIPVIAGEKTENERFPGAQITLTLEAMMQDKKAMQAATSHYLGQNFSKAANIQFLAEDGKHHFVHTTSWGLSTRSIGGLIMVHGDDDGLKVPPKLAPTQVVIMPVVPKEEERAKVIEYAEKVKQALLTLTYDHEKIRVKIDARDIRGGDKNWQWVKKGAPIRIEIGPRDITEKNVVLFRRDEEAKNKNIMKFDELASIVPKILTEMHSNYYQAANDYLQANITHDVNDLASLKKYYGNEEKEAGFVCTWIKDDDKTIAALSELKLSIRCIPKNGVNKPGKCLITGEKVNRQVIIARSY